MVGVMKYIVAILKYLAVFVVGYVVNFVLVLLWIAGAFTPPFKPEALFEGILFVLVMATIPITVSVVYVSIVVVAMRSRPLWLHLCASIAMSLMVPGILACVLRMPPQGRPVQFAPALFLPPIFGALSMVCGARALFRLKKNLSPVTSPALGVEGVSRTTYILESVGMGVCIGYVLICWAAYFGRVGNMHPGVRYHPLFPAGLASTLIGFALSVLTFRRRPVLASFTLAGCLLFAIWSSSLPRL